MKLRLVWVLWVASASFAADGIEPKIEHDTIRLDSTVA